MSHTTKNTAAASDGTAWEDQVDRGMQWTALIVALALWAVLTAVRWMAGAIAFTAQRLAEVLAGVISDLAIQLDERWLVAGAEDMTSWARRDAAYRARVHAERVPA